MVRYPKPETRIPDPGYRSLNSLFQVALHLPSQREHDGALPGRSQAKWEQGFGMRDAECSTPNSKP